MFLRADKLDKQARAATGDARVRMPTTDEWHDATKQSRGETILSLLLVALDSSERRLFLLDEPEAAVEQASFNPNIDSTRPEPPCRRRKGSLASPAGAAANVGFVER